MPGIFAFWGAQVDLAHLRLAAAGAVRQSVTTDPTARHADAGHGWAARYRNGQGACHHGVEALDTRLPTLPLDPAVVVGCAGDDLQPLVSSDRALVHHGSPHRGTLPPAVSTAASLSLAYQRARLDLNPVAALKHVVELAQQTTWVTVVLDDDGHLYGHRCGHPLWQCLYTKAGVHWSSQPCCPHARPLPELAVFSTLGEPS